MKEIKTMDSYVENVWDIIGQFDGESIGNKTDVVILARNKTQHIFVAWSGTIVEGHLDVFNGYYTTTFEAVVRDFHRKCLSFASCFKD